MSTLTLHYEVYMYERIVISNLPQPLVQKFQKCEFSVNIVSNRRILLGKLEKGLISSIKSQKNSQITKKGYLHWVTGLVL